MRLCVIEKCSKKHYGHGLCSMHYLRNKRNGDPNKVQAIRGSDPEELKQRKRQQKRAARLAWRERDLEGFRAYKNKYHRLWVAKNSEKMKLIRIASEAKRRAVTARGKVDLIKLRKEWNGNCGICDLPVKGKSQFDHIKPLSRGGEHSQSNLQITHPDCNRKKWANYEPKRYELAGVKR